MAKHSNMVIEDAAYYLLMHEGYEGLSYKKVADACGLKRASIQYYFPSKADIPVGFWIRALNIASDFLEARAMLDDDANVSLTRVGMLHYSFLMSTPELKRATKEIIESRAITWKLIEEQLTWSADRFGFNEPGLDMRDIMNGAATQASGGVFESLYVTLENGTDISGTEIARHFELVFLKELEHDKAYIKKVVDDEAMTEELLETGISFITSRMGKLPNQQSQ